MVTDLDFGVFTLVYFAFDFGVSFKVLTLMLLLIGVMNSLLFLIMFVGLFWWVFICMIAFLFELWVVCYDCDFVMFVWVFAGYLVWVMSFTFCELGWLVFLFWVGFNFTVLGLIVFGLVFALIVLLLFMCFVVILFRLVRVLLFTVCLLIYG